MRSEVDSTIALRGAIVIIVPATWTVFLCILSYLALPDRPAEPSKVQVENVRLACVFSLLATVTLTRKPLPDG